MKFNNEIYFIKNGTIMSPNMLHTTIRDIQIHKIILDQQFLITKLSTSNYD